MAPLLGLLIVLVVFSAGAHADYYSPATLMVHVQDIDGNSIPNATVSIEKANLTYTTDKAGDVTIYLGSGGNFTVRVSKNGYQTTFKNITVAENSTVSIIITLIQNNTTVTNEHTGYLTKAKSIYNAHKVAIIGGGIIFLLLLLVIAQGNKKRRW